MSNTIKKAEELTMHIVEGKSDFETCVNMVKEFSQVKGLQDQLLDFLDFLMVNDYMDNENNEQRQFMVDEYTGYSDDTQPPHRKRNLF